MIVDEGECWKGGRMLRSSICGLYSSDKVSGNTEFCTPTAGRICVHFYFILFSGVQNAMAPALTREEVASAQLKGDYAIKSESTTPRLDTSQWPLLLKNYDKLLVRSSHFTPIPSGCSPLKRDITSYVKHV